MSKSLVYYVRSNKHIKDSGISINCNLPTVVKLNEMQARRTIRVHNKSIGLLKNPKYCVFLFDRLCGLVVHVHDDLH